jgi:DNA-binding response OmpR family regulator
MNTSIHAKKNILIIDDAQELLQVLELILGRFGYDVVIKNCPEGVSEFVQNTKVDLLLLDVRLRGVNGRFICQELKSNAKTNYFPVILMSSYSSSLTNLGECGADGFIEKPFNLDELISKVNKIINSKTKMNGHSPN